MKNRIIAVASLSLALSGTGFAQGSFDDIGKKQQIRQEQEARINQEKTNAKIK